MKHLASIGYIMRNANPVTATYQYTKNKKRQNRRATRGAGGGRPRRLFFENLKQCPDFGKKGRDFIHPWVRFSVQGIVLRVSRILSLPCVFFN